MNSGRPKHGSNNGKYPQRQHHQKSWENEDDIKSVRKISSMASMKRPSVNSYEWAKRTKFLLAVGHIYIYIYKSPRWHSNSSKTFRKIERYYNKFVLSI